MKFHFLRILLGMKGWRYFQFFFLCMLSLTAIGQSVDLNVHHLSTEDGLGDGVARAIGQDRYGYMWIGTVSGLSRFDGNKVKRFQSEPGKKGSVPFSVPRDILGDAKGNLWIGFNEGLYRFDYASEEFRLVKYTEAYVIKKIREDSANHKLYLLTNKGIARYDYVENVFGFVYPILDERINDFDLQYPYLYAISDQQIFSWNIQTSQISQFSPTQPIEGSFRNLTVDRKGIIWFSTYYSNGKVYSLSKDWTTIKPYLFSKVRNAQSNSNNRVLSLFIDNRNRLWITTVANWIFSYDSNTARLNWYPFRASKSNTVSLFTSGIKYQSNNGYIWLTTEGYGVDYFDPDNNPFNIILPYDKPDLPQNFSWARCTTEDPKGNIWMGWVSGVSRISQRDKSISNFENLPGKPAILHSPSVRSILSDEKGDIWIGTSRGVNRYVAKTQKMEFLDERDSLPKGFYWSIMQDHQKNIWFGTGNNLYYKSHAEGRVFNCRYHPVLAAAIDTGVRVIYEDSKRFLWFGLDGGGLVRYDPAQMKYSKWKRSATNGYELLSNTIVGIAEDQQGVIWISSFNGLVSYQPQTGKFQQYTYQQGLPANKCAGILVDPANRIWIATGAGLTQLDAGRKNFTTYTVEDGLPTIEFSDMPATRLKNGEFLFPSIRGYVQFDPLKILGVKDKLDVYLSAINIFDQPYKAYGNTEDLKVLNLKPDQNFFSFDLVGLNYSNAGQTWYTYMLEGFDKEWITTQNRTVNYTNVPGGNYIFRYKASTNPYPVDVPDKELAVNIATVYYESIWFWLLMAVLSGSLLYFWYRRRLNSNRKMFELQSRAQNLEKEKALVMYDSLKQQLNPHFLFNSLSSLGSLIRTDQHLAASFLDNLSKIYRYILQSQESDLTTLDKELKFLASYIELLKTRFQKGLQIKIGVDDQCLNARIVPVTLQNLIDNAIKHNMLDEEAPLVIEIFTEGNELFVRNNLQKKNAVETSNRQGLQNLKALYQYLTQHPVTITETDQYFTIKIPLI